MSGQAKEGSTSTKKCPATVAAPRKPRPPRARIDGALLNQEFLDHELMDGNTPPRCPVEALKLPRLRRCAFDVSTLVFTGTINPVRTFLQERLDGGIDGYNWKIRFRDSGPFVLKVFWDQEPPTPPFYYALQRECQAAAVLQLMQAALAQDDPSLGPILVYPHPWDWVEGHENMLAFSDEWRRRGLPDDCASIPVTTITSMPRIRKCYGWIKIMGDTLYQLPLLWRPPPLKIEKTLRQMEPDVEYTALVYEYVEEGENDAAVIEESLNFFRDAGFSHTGISLACNWKQSVLIDMSDIIYPGGFGWKHWELTAQKVLRATPRQN